MPHPVDSYRLIVETWRAATTTGDLSELLEWVAKRLREGGAPAELTLWRVQPTAWKATRVATTATPQPGGADRDMDEQVARIWRDMSELGTALILGDAQRGPLRKVLAPSDDVGTGIVVPVPDDGALLCALVIWRRVGSWTEADRALVEELAGPMATALRLHNERHEATRAREALEADRRALLQRLDRDDLGDALIGADSGLQDVITRAAQVAPTDAPVLLLGETGAGKEVVARAIHRRSRRAAGPIVRVNCGAIPHGLIDSELFGHERGAFTGAIGTRKGWFERADGGTLFLDEIGELPADAQVRLLRVLQDGVFERVGAQRSLRVDVRIVAATHRDLQSMVDDRRFREDLWYRLNVFPITIPPLRARREDIPALASHFAARAGTRIGGKPLTLTPDDIDTLVSYDWPGNVRELAAVIERAVILGSGRFVAVRAALGSVEERRGGRVATTDAAAELVPLDVAMARHIELALRACQGKIEGRGGAAALLRINPHTLRARMRKLRVDAQRIRASLTPAP